MPIAAMMPAEGMIQKQKTNSTKRALQNPSLLLCASDSIRRHASPFRRDR
jgi:hypothetical protein